MWRAVLPAFPVVLLLAGLIWLGTAVPVGSQPTGGPAAAAAGDGTDGFGAQTASGPAVMDAPGPQPGFNPDPGGSPDTRSGNPDGANLQETLEQTDPGRLGGNSPNSPASAGPDLPPPPETEPRRKTLDQDLRPEERQDLATFEAELFTTYERRLQSDLDLKRQTLAALAPLEQELGLASEATPAPFRHLAQQAHRLQGTWPYLYPLLFAGSLGPAEVHAQPFLWEDLRLFEHPAFLIAGLRLHVSFLEEKLRRVGVIRREVARPAGILETAH